MPDHCRGLNPAGFWHACGSPANCNWYHRDTRARLASPWPEWELQAPDAVRCLCTRKGCFSRVSQTRSQNLLKKPAHRVTLNPQCTDSTKSLWIRGARIPFCLQVCISPLLRLGLLLSSALFSHWSQPLPVLAQPLQGFDPITLEFISHTAVCQLHTGSCSEDPALLAILPAAHLEQAAFLSQQGCFASSPSQALLEPGTNF